MPLIYETKNFVVEAVEKPLSPREDGGHIKISPKKRISDRTKMQPKMAIEFIRLTMIIGESMKKGLAKTGIKIVRINYQDNGNWAFKEGKEPYFHLHLYGRTAEAKYHKWPEAMNFPDRSSGFYDNFEPLNAGDVEEIQKQIELILKEEKFQEKEWKL